MKTTQFSSGKFSRDREQIYQARNQEGEWLEYDTLEEALAIAKNLDTAMRVVDCTHESWTYERESTEA